MKKILVALVLAIFFFNAGFGRLLAPLLYTMTPLQRYYLLAYLASTWQGNDPSATTTVAWIWKTPKKGRPEFAMEQDLIPKPTLDTLWAGESLPFLMSRQAQLGGWTGIYKGASHPVNAAAAKDLLREEFFDGESLGSFFLQPALAGGMALVLLLWFRSWRKAQWKQHWWRAPESTWALVWRWALESSDRVSEPQQQAKQLRLLDAPRQLAAPVPAPVIEAQMAAKPETQSAPKSMPGMATAGTGLGAQPPVPAAAMKTKAVFVWDESKGID